MSIFFTVFLVFLGFTSIAQNFDSYSVNKDQDNQRVRIYWESARKYDSTTFRIQRSFDALTWETIETLSAVTPEDSLQCNCQGQETKYTVYDYFPQTGKNYYRIEQRLLRGQLVYAPVQSVLFTPNINAPIALYPNPVKEQLFLLRKEPSLLQETPELYNINGQLLRSYTDIGYDEFLELPLDNLERGIYILRIGNRSIPFQKI